MSVKKLSAEKILEIDQRRIGLSMAAAMRVLGFQLHAGANDDASTTMNAIAYLSHQLFVAENPDAGPSAAERAEAVHAATEAAEVVQAGGVH